MTYVDVEVGPRAFTIAVHESAVHESEAFGVADKDEPGFGSSPDWVFDEVAKLVGFLHDESKSPAIFGDRAKETRHGSSGRPSTPAVGYRSISPSDGPAAALMSVARRRARARA